MVHSFFAALTRLMLAVHTARHDVTQPSSCVMSGGVNWLLLWKNLARNSEVEHVSVDVYLKKREQHLFVRVYSRRWMMNG